MVRSGIIITRNAIIIEPFLLQRITEMSTDIILISIFMQICIPHGLVL